MRKARNFLSPYVFAPVALIALSLSAFTVLFIIKFPASASKNHDEGETTPATSEKMPGGENFTPSPISILELLSVESQSDFFGDNFFRDENLSQVVFAPAFLPNSSTCVASLSPVHNAFQWQGGTGSFNVNAPPNCHWTATSGAPWLEITSGQSGAGDGTVAYRAANNHSKSRREADITVGGFKHRVQQSGRFSLNCALELNPANQNIPANGIQGGAVNVAAGCFWRATSESPWLRLTGKVSGFESGAVSFDAEANPGAQPRQARIRFDSGILLFGTTVFATVTQAGNQILTVNAGADQTIALPNSVQLNGTITYNGSQTINSLWSKLSGPGAVSFGNAGSLSTTAAFSQEGIYVLQLTASDGVLSASDDVTITVNPESAPPPPDPSTVAPPLDETVTTNIAEATEFLYAGANPIQTGVDPDDIDPKRVGLLRGRVLNKSGQPISNVKISILNHPELGQTRSRADGMFDLVVNGGGDLTVKYEKQGFIPSQREEKIDWQQYATLEDVVLISYDGNVSFIDLSSSAPIQVAESGVITDADGTRRSRLFFKQGTTATMTLPDDSTQPLVQMNVRSTEFTVGANGAETMPGDLPPTSAYTYASEYSVDEAVALSAKKITFSQPVVQYNENFLNFPVGIDVPSGSYDRETGDWIPSANGRVVKILSITSGAANLDLDGSGNAATDAEYAALGVNLAERQRLATIYPVNQILWRVPVIHFSPWDSNWGFGPPDDAVPPPKKPKSPPNDKDCKFCSVGARNQSLGEEIPITGTSFFLRYNSERQKGNVSNRSLQIPLSGGSVPASLKNIKLTVGILGREFEQTFPAQPNQATTFVWDGKDAYGREAQGSQLATVKIAFVYDGVYQQTYNFASLGTGVAIEGSRTRREIEFVSRYTAYLSNFDFSKMAAIGGWSLNVHHVYDPNEKALFQGDGKRRSANSISNIVTTSAGSGQFGFAGDGGPAKQARLAYPGGVAIAPDGSYFIADTVNNRVRKVLPTGIISTVAGDGNQCSPTSACGDGGQATLAQLFNPTDVAVGADGSLYISDTNSNRIRRVAPNGVISTIAGTGEECLPTDACGDDGAAISAKLNKPQYIDLAADGTLFVADGGSRRARRIATDGNISTVAGSGNEGCGSDDVPARAACLENPSGIALAPDGSLYISAGDSRFGKIYRVGTNGVIKTAAASECSPAIAGKIETVEEQPSICGAQGLTVGSDGNVYFTAFVVGALFKLDNNGTTTIIAGAGFQGGNDEGQPALQVTPFGAYDVAFFPNGSLLVADTSANRIRQIQPLLPGFSNTDILIPSEDGSEVFQFNSAGKHLKTINALTNADKYVFAYDGAGRLTTVTDGDGNTTTIQRDASGKPTGIFSPYNQLTTLALDANNYLSAITNPAGAANQFTYTADGLMLTEKDALNNQNTFTYDAVGRLVRDDDAATGFQTLARSELENGYAVARNTALNRVSTFKVEEQNGDVINTNTAPDGTQDVETIGANGVNTLTAADGTFTETTLGPDPRWLMQSPLDARRTVTTPNGLNFNSTFSSAVTLSDPFNPLSLISKTDTLTVNGKTSTRVFTTNNRTFVETSPLNRQTTTVVNAQTRPTQTQFANLNPVNLTYDARGRLSSATSGAGASARVFTYAYNAAGFLSVLTNPLNQTNNFTYDLAGRVTQQTLADSRVIGFGYDADGNLTSLTPPGRPAHTFAYNAVNLVSSYTAPNVGGSSTTTYAYNLDKQITKITRPDSLQINNIYDAAGRLQTLTVPNGNYGFAYNATTGLLDGITAPGGGSLAYEYDGFLPTRQTWTGTIAGNVSQTYDNDFRVSSQSVNGANTVNFAYDNDNLLIGAGGLSLARNAQNGLLTGTTLGGVIDTFSYNNFGEPTNYNAKFNAATLYDVNYAYDKLGRITQKTENISGVTTTYDYGYDSTGRLTTVTLDGGAQPMVIYGYDNNNNRTSFSLSGVVTNAGYDAQDRLTNYGATGYAYTANGELQSKTDGANTTQYGYDVLGNLRNVTLPNGTIIEYLIDGQDRRIGKRVNGTLAQGFLYQDQLEPVAELDGSNNVVSRFVYGTRSNVPDYIIKGGATYRIITDHLGSVRLVVNVATGAIAQRIDYDEFGVVLQDTNPGFQPFGFAGGIYDAQTRLTRFGARDYDAETGRWTAKDPILFDSGDTNLYSYVLANPVNNFDSNGLNPTLPIPTPGGVSGGLADLFLPQIADFERYLIRRCPTFGSPKADDIKMWGYRGIQRVETAADALNPLNQVGPVLSGLGNVFNALGNLGGAIAGNR